MTIRNLTPHPVVILRDDADGVVVGFTGVGPASKEGRFTLIATIAPAGIVARAVQKDEPVGTVEVEGYAVPQIRTVFGSPTDLPSSEAGVMFVVSVITAQAAKVAGRDTSDLLITSDPVRDSSGRFIGVRKFAVI